VAQVTVGAPDKRSLSGMSLFVRCEVSVSGPPAR